eukprot:8039568-Pyramimonas_sp.AAC.1
MICDFVGGTPSYARPFRGAALWKTILRGPRHVGCAQAPPCPLHAHSPSMGPPSASHVTARVEKKGI